MPHNYDPKCMCEACNAYEYALSGMIAEEEKEIAKGKEKYRNKLRFENNAKRDRKFY